QWGLLSTYPISAYIFLWGKWLGLATVLLTIIFFSFGVSGLLTFFFGVTLPFLSFIFFVICSVALSLVYFSIAFLIGYITRNRWLTVISGNAIRFFTISNRRLLLISSLSQLPCYQLIRPFMGGLTRLNPAQFIRVFSII